jgi:hypothetical protein
VVAPCAFRAPKTGSRQAEYEDAIAWSRSRRRYAVADGASAGAFARLWAYLLVNAYAAGWLRAESLEQDLSPVQERWTSLVAGRGLAWYAHEQARRGAFAALVGLSLIDDRRWSALAVGDCCLFQVRGETLLVAFPLASADDFDNRPLLIGSRSIANQELRSAGAIASATGTWQRGDTFLLMSDALAATFLRAQRADAEFARSGSPLAVLDFDRTQPGFRAWVRSLRAQRQLRNDDVSLLWLSIGPDAVT